MKVSSCTQTNPLKPKPFDINSEADDKELKTWCQFHWQHVIQKGVHGHNSPTYHDCCIAFSRRSCGKRISHPSIQSASVLKIPAIRYSSCHEDLYRWLKARLKLHHRLGNKTYFPSINTAHITTDDDIDDDPEDQLEMLGKRCTKLLEDLFKAQQENDKLKKENMMMMKATQNWCTKYQELLVQQSDDTPSYAETTPLKLIPKEKEDLLNY